MLDHYVMSSAHSTLASIAEDPDAYAKAIAGGLSAEDFAVAAHRKAFAEIDRWYQDHPHIPAPLEILKRADVEEGMAGLFGESSLVVLADARREREHTEHVRRAVLAAQNGDMAGARACLALADALTKPRDAAIPLLSTAQIFEPVPPTSWVIPDLQIAPGRPSMLAGYGASAKTLAAQQLALACASGKPVFGFFAPLQCRVVHFDLEQGSHATRKRYQRLAIGHGIDSLELEGRLELAPFPSVLLDSPNAADVYSRTFEGVQVGIIDSMRAATPSIDENDSQIRRCLDVLTLVSERTGTAFVVIHHAGKPKDGHADARTVLRGSSAIFDACGSVLLISAPREDGEPRTVRQLKQPADGTGAPLEPFGLVVEDVALGGDLTAGVRVLHRTMTPPDSRAAIDEALARDLERVLEVVRATPGCSHRHLRAHVGLGAARVDLCAGLLLEQGTLSTLDAPRGGKAYHLGGRS
jgi:hypothetical protein